MTPTIELNPREYGLSNAGRNTPITFETEDSNVNLNHPHEIRLSLDPAAAQPNANPNIKSFHPLEDPSQPITRRRASLIITE